MLPEFLVRLLAAQLLLAPQPSAPDPCTLVSASDIAAAVGGKPSSGSKEGPTRDEGSGAELSNCSYRIGELYLVLEVAQFPDDAGAAAAMKETARVANDPEVGMAMTVQPGPGDGALWGGNGEGAIWLARKGKYTLSVTLAGELGDGAKYRDPLKRLTSAALSKL